MLYLSCSSSLMHVRRGSEELGEEEDFRLRKFSSYVKLLHYDYYLMRGSDVFMNTNKNTSNIKRTLLTGLTAAAFTVFLLLLGAGMKSASADQISLSFSSTDGSGCVDISDEDYFTTEYFDPGTEITMSSDTPIDALYVVWEQVPGEWTLQINGRDYTFGQDGYLHEYVKIPEEAGQATSVTLVVKGARITIADIYGLSAGSLPSFVQTWEPSYDQADILFLSTHADDEALFFGGVIPNYTDKENVRVQVAYFTDLFQSEPYRNHEILNGLWTMGVTHYPQLGEFYDYYSESLEEAQEQYSYELSLEYVVRTIRRFKPQVVIAQDVINGEYGHGGHIWSAMMVQDAAEITADPEKYTDSANRYGTWDVPKIYFHLYPENAIELDARKPLSSFGGKTALEIAVAAYEEHQSQQWCWFYVSDGYDEEGNPDGYEYSCTKYGLYRSLVGADTSNDILENIVTYDDQARIAAEEAEAAEAAARAAELAQQAEETPSAQSVVEDSNPTAVAGGKNTTAITILIILAVIILLIIIGVIVISRSRAKIKEKQRRLERKRQEAEARARGSYRSNVNSSRTYRTNYSSSHSSQGSSGSSAERSRQSNAGSSSGTQVRRSSNGSYQTSRSSNGTYRTRSSETDSDR